MLFLRLRHFHGMNCLVVVYVIVLSKRAKASRPHGPKPRLSGRAQPAHHYESIMTSRTSLGKSPMFEVIVIPGFTWTVVADMLLTIKRYLPDAEGERPNHIIIRNLQKRIAQPKLRKHIVLDSLWAGVDCSCVDC